MERKFDEMLVSVAAHPNQNLFAVGSVDGTVVVSSYDTQEASTASDDDDEEADEVTEKPAGNSLKFGDQWTRKHKAAVRKIRFSKSGDHLFSLTKNKAFTHFDVETGKKIRCIQKAHDASPYSFCVIDENQVASGDENGCVKVWDWRSAENPPCIFESNETEEYVTDLFYGDDGKTLLVTSGDCTLIALDLRKKKMILQSETMHSELLSIARVAGKVACGAADKYVELFNWGEWGNIVERVATHHKDTVDCLVTVDDNLLLSGSADGTIRLINICPNLSIGVVGRHSEGVEDMCLANGEKFLISCGQDCKVKFWDIKSIKSSAPKTHSGSKMKKIATKKRKAGTFFDDLGKE